MEGVGGSGSSSACPFLRRSSTKRSYSSMSAPTHPPRSRSPGESLFVSDTESDDYERPSHYQRTNNGLALPRRHIGDGFDFRRPITGGSEASGTSGNADRNGHTVIDLTAEDDSQPMAQQPTSAPEAGPAAGSSRAQRPPRFGRNIIDVGSEDEDTDQQPPASAPEPPRLGFTFGHRSFTDYNPHPRYSILRRPTPTTRNHNHPHTDMDEVQFLDERPRSRPQPDSSRSRTPATHVQRSVTPYPTGLHAPIDLTGDDDEVVHLNTRTRPGGVNNDRPGITGGLGTVGLEDEDDDVGFGGMLARNPRLLQRLDQAGGIRAQQARFLQLSHDRHRHIGTDNANRRRNDNGPMIRFGMGLAMGMGMGDGGPLAVAMDYGMPAFDMGFEGANQPPPPKYEPPEPAKEGFTRSPEEDEEVVCPNCGDELAMGDTENKQHVWVIKKCGHAYCGDCATNRPKSTKKGKAPASGPFPFKNCVVDGCQSSASLRSMVRVFIDS